jgi:type IV pilus assembly protein PilW
MRSHKQSGFTLVELMIAMVLGLLLTGGLVSMLSQARLSFKQDENIARMQDEARFAIRELSKDISMAGYVADLIIPDAVDFSGSLEIGEDCNADGEAEWAYRFEEPVSSDGDMLTSLDNATAGDATDAFTCLDGGEFVVGSDVIAVKRVASFISAAPADGQVVMRTNGTVGELYLPPAASTIGAPADDWSYSPVIYFIRNFTEVAGDGVPSLCRKVLQAGDPPAMVTECIAQGVENMQIEYGLDANGDGAVNFYIADPTLAEIQQIVSTRVHLLVRAVEIDVAYTNGKTYSLGNAADFTPNDQFRRRVYTTTVGIPNLRNRALMGI